MDGAVTATFLDNKTVDDGSDLCCCCSNVNDECCWFTCCKPRSLG